MTLTLPAYIFLLAFCFYTGGGIEYRRQKWLQSRSPWDIARMILGIGSLIAVAFAIPQGGMQAAIIAIGIPSILNILVGAVESLSPSKDNHKRLSVD